tara:strand:+ start:224 stop:1060 length:837 start_codon:yes stop_codon:yes gene_type:complete
MNKLFLIILLSINYAIGIDALDLPNSAQSLALSNTGIASPLNSSINASYKSSNQSFASFSSNYWLKGVSGKTILNQFGNHEISLNSFGIDDLQLWGDKPDSDPLGTFGLEFSCLSYRYLLSKNSNQDFGVKVKGIYSKLYTDSIYGFLFDLGFSQKLSKSFNFGMIIKNVGFTQSDLSISKLPEEYGVGVSYNNDSLGLLLLSDYLYSDVRGNIFKVGYSLDLNFFNIYGALNQFETNRYISTGFEIKYKNILFSYGILFQEIKVLGTPQSFQITLYY